MELWRKIALEMRFTTALRGGVPLDPKILNTWLELRVATDPAFKKLQRDTEHLPATLDDICAVNEQSADRTEGHGQGFLRDDVGIYVRGGSIRAHFKSAIDALGPEINAGRVPELKSFKQFAYKAKRWLWVEDDKVRIRDAEGQPYPTGTNFVQHTVNGMTAQGPRVSLVQTEEVFPATICCTVKIGESVGDITRDILDLLLQYGCVAGFNQDRSLQFGQYEYTLGE